MVNQMLSFLQDLAESKEMKTYQQKVLRLWVSKKREGREWKQIYLEDKITEKF